MTASRLRTLLAFPAAWLVTCLSACSSPPPPVERVFLITIDTLRADHVGSYGYPRNITPWIDRMAAEGILFERAYSSSSHTAPSHASMLTGVYPKQHGVLHNMARLPEAATTLASLLGERGFATAGFSAVRFLVGLEAGFDHFETNRTRPSRRGNQPARIGVDKALRWIEQRDPDDSYFVWLHLYDAHQWHRIEAPADRLSAARKASELAPDELKEFLRREHGMDPNWQSPVPPLEAIDRYDSQILEMDRQLARLYETLEARGDLEDSLIVITADHGEGLGSHRVSGHGMYLYREQIRVPLILRFAGGRLGGLRRSQVVRHVDLLPTIAELTGIDGESLSPSLAGRSLVPLLLGDDSDPPRLAFAQRRPADPQRLEQGWQPGDVVSLEDGSFKYIYHSDGPDEFYDLTTDPLELSNLIGEASADQRRLHSALVRMNRAMLDAATESHLLDDSHRDALRALGYLQ